MRGRVRPYLIADPGSVQFGAWEYRHGDTWEALAGAVSDWDYNTDLQIRASVAIDAEAFRESVGLESDVELRLTVGWRCTDGRIGDRALSVPVGEATPDELLVMLPGNRLGPEIDLATRIVLAADVPATRPGVAHLAGSVLWEQITKVLLAGVGGRFPVMVVDFGASGLDADASWVLDLPTDLGAPVQGSLVLLINSCDSDLVAAASGRRKGAEGLLEDLHEEVAVQLLDHAVAHAAELEADDWDEASLGATLSILADRVDGGVGALAALRVSHPTAYRAKLVGEARRNGFGRRIR